MRKAVFCICENKDADQLRGNRETDQRLCFRYTDTCNTIPLLSKSEIFKPLAIFCVGLCPTWSQTSKTGFLTTSFMCKSFCCFVCEISISNQLRSYPLQVMRKCQYTRCTIRGFRPGATQTGHTIVCLQPQNIARGFRKQISSTFYEAKTKALSISAPC